MDSSIRESLVFRIDEKLLQLRPPRLTLAATLAALCKRMRSGELDANLVVDILNENHLLPYMINSQTKSVVDLSLGRNTSASKVGDLIVSDECIRGTYELCLSFLDFVLATLRNPYYQDTSRAMLASIIFILNEIYPSHYIWTYRNIADMDQILCLCTEIFHHVICNIGHTNNEPSELERVCIYSLSQNQAHKQLLDVIVDGKNIVKKKTSELDRVTEQILVSIPMVVCVRQSLYIFNQLLSQSKHVKALLKEQEVQLKVPSVFQAANSSSDSPMTNIESALLDTNVRPGLLQHLFGYIYKEGDDSTACLAVDLIKNMAKKFSMSLMACLGSEAEKVCEFFVDCLNCKDSDIKLQVAILDLLSTCVKHQPGLIELFLNFKRAAKPHETTNGGNNITESLNSLDVVMKVLKDCRFQQGDAQKLLHTYVMKFILTFWQKQHSAVEQFDKKQDFWESIAHPLVSFVDNSSQNSEKSLESFQNMSDQLNSYAMMILAREIFCLNAEINGREMNKNLRNIINELGTKNLLEKYSASIRRRYEKIADNLDRAESYNRILVAWRDFIVSVAKFKPIEINDGTKNQIIRDTLACLTHELRLDEKLDKERVVVIGDILLLTWTRWNNTHQKSSSEDLFRSMHELLYLIDSTKEHLPFAFLLTFQSTLNNYLIRQHNYLIDSNRSYDLIVPAMQVMQFAIKIVERHINQGEQSKNSEFTYKPGVESRLCFLSIMSLKFIIDVSRADASLWISYLSINLQVNSLIQFLRLLIRRRLGDEICHSVIDLLLSLSYVKESANYLNKSGVINQVNMIAVSSYERPNFGGETLKERAGAPTGPPTNSCVGSSNIGSVSCGGAGAGGVGGIGGVSGGSSGTGLAVGGAVGVSGSIGISSGKIGSNGQRGSAEEKWLAVYCHVIRLNVSMLLTLDDDYLTTAIEFFSIHCMRICETLERLRLEARQANQEEEMQLVHLINLLLRHKKIWIRRDKQSFEAVSDQLQWSRLWLLN